MIYFATEFVVEPLAPEKLFSVGPLDVTNSLLVGWLGAIFLVIVFWLAARARQVSICCRKPDKRCVQFIG